MPETTISTVDQHVWASDHAPERSTFGSVPRLTRGPLLISSCAGLLAVSAALWIGGDHESAAAQSSPAVSAGTRNSGIKHPAQIAPALSWTELKSGERLTNLLLRRGIGSLDAAIADRLATEAGELPAGTQVAIEWSAPDRHAGEFARIQVKPRLGTVITITRVGEMLSASTREVAVDTRPLRLRGRVGLDLATSLKAAGATAAEIKTYITALQSRISLGDIGPEDRFDLLVQLRSTDMGEIENGPLLFAGLERAAGGSLQLVRWSRAEGAQWVDVTGEQTGAAGPEMIQPINARVTSGFGARVHPILRFLRLHRGVDYGAPTGTPVVAASGGVVTAAGWAGGYGNQVRIAHPDGVETSYSHLSSVAVAAGQPIRLGQPLGRVGSTGLSTGPHLHFELRRHGQPVDPLGTRIAAQPVRTVVSASAAKARMRDLLSLAYRDRRG